MISKTINHIIPNWSIISDQSCFYRTNHISGSVFENHKTTIKIRHLKIVGMVNAIHMLT